MSDQEITCSDCGDVFVFREAEQLFYSERGLASPPKRCKACRQARRASQEGGGGGGGGGRGNGPPRDSRDRGPRFPSNSGGNAGGYRGANGSNGAPPWQSRGPGRPGGDSRPAGGDRPRFDRRDDRRGPPPPRAFGGGGAPGANRGPAPTDARPPRAPAEWGTRAPRESVTTERADPPADRPRARPPRPERPRYDITCAECGTQAQVPFKPLEGRQVFCQPCYRARKGTATPAEAVGDGEDTGIVE